MRPVLDGPIAVIGTRPALSAKPGWGGAGKPGRRTRIVESRRADVDGGPDARARLLKKAREVGPLTTPDSSYG